MYKTKHAQKRDATEVNRAPTTFPIYARPLCAHLNVVVALTPRTCYLYAYANPVIPYISIYIAK